jgi:hypothetical protein
MTTETCQYFPRSLSADVGIALPSNAATQRQSNAALRTAAGQTIEMAENPEIARFAANAFERRIAGRAALTVHPATSFRLPWRGLCFNQSID